MTSPLRRRASALLLLTLFLFQAAVVPVDAARVRTPDNFALGFDPAATLAASALAKDAPLRYSVPLANIKPSPGPIRLVHAKARQTLTVAISDRFQAKDALLDIVFTNSISLLDGRSQLRFYWDDRLLAQVPLKSKQPEGRVTFRIPKEWLTGGYHPVRFEASQHYEQNAQCEDPMASELWTEIDTLHSSFSIIGDMKPVAPISRLSDLDVLLDPKMPDGERIHFVTTRPTQVGDPRLTWLSLASQGAALRLKYNSLLATHGESLKPTGDQIVCATWQETSSLIRNMPSIPVKGGAIVLMPLPADPRYFLLVLTGQTDDDVSQAVQAFAHADFSTVPASRVDLSTVSLPPLKDLTLAGRVKLGQTYNLSHFGYVTKVLRGMESGDIQITFKMPPDIYPSEDRQVAFHLNFGYSPGIRKDSASSLYINGNFQQAINFTSEGGGFFRDYLISVPMSSFQPGTNTIVIDAKMLPSIGGRCEIFDDEKMVFTLVDDSRITFADAAHFASMPSLKLTSDTAFPFARDPAHPPVIYLAQGDPALLGSALTILGKLAQKSGEIVDYAFSYDPPTQSCDVLAVGAADKIDPKYYKGGPWQQTGEAHFWLPKSSDYSKGGTTGWIPADLTGERLASQPVSPPVKIKGVYAPGDSGFLVEYERPDSSGNTVLLFTARDAETLQARAHGIVTPDHWETLQGDTAVWDGSHFAVHKAGENYAVGSKKASIRFNFYFSNHVSVLVGAVLIALALFAYLTRYLIVRLRKKKHGEAGTKH